MLALTKISGNGFRPSLFGNSVNDHRVFYLGLTAIDWFNRAQAAVAKYDGLLARAKAIAAASERDAVLSWIGSASDQESPAYRYAAVAEDVDFAGQGENMDHYVKTHVQNRVPKLEAFNNELETKVRVAEMVTGGTPTPTPTGTTPAGRTPTPVAAKTDWTLPLVIGGGAIAVAIIVTIVAKKK
jgi:hypothetical protein